MSVVIRSRWRSQPPFGTPLDMGHPLVRRMSSCVLPGPVGSNFCVDILNANGLLLPYNNPTAAEVRAYGNTGGLNFPCANGTLRAYYLDVTGGVAYVRGDPGKWKTKFNAGNAPFSHATVIAPMNQSGGWGGPGIACAWSGSQPSSIGVDQGFTSYNLVLSHAYNNTTNGDAYSSNVKVDPTTGQQKFYAVAGSMDGTYHRFAAGGRQVDKISSTIVPYITEVNDWPSKTYISLNKYNEGTKKAVAFFAMWFGYAMNDGELLAFTDNPWDIFLPRGPIAATMYVGGGSVISADTIESLTLTDSGIGGLLYTSTNAESLGIVDAVSATGGINVPRMTLWRKWRRRTAPLAMLGKFVSRKLNYQTFHTLTFFGYASPNSATISGSVSESSTPTDLQTATSSLVASQTESVTPTDAQSGAALYPVAQAESLTATDTGTMQSAGIAASTNETLTATDSQSAIATLIASMVESVTATDSCSLIATFVGSIVEALTPTDAPSGVSTLLVARVESLTPVDAPDATAGIPIGTVEALTPTDASSALATFVATTAESATPADVSSMTNTTSATTAEAPTLTDTGTGQLAGIQATQAEALTPTDVAGNVVTFVASTQESVSAADVPSATATMGVSQVESLTPVDVKDMTSGSNVQQNETLTVTDTSSGVNIVAVARVESLTPTDAQSALSALVTQTMESLTAADVSIAGALFQAFIVETVSLVDQSSSWTGVVVLYENPRRMVISTNDLLIAAREALREADAEDGRIIIASNPTRTIQ